jgi:hypothetical protein
MNIQLGRQSLGKTELERVCLSYLRMLPRCQHIKSVMIAPRPGSQRNWVVIEIDPPLPTAADNDARNALAELQGEFRLAG